MATIETRNKSYQRGLVLGFTMAEVALLIIFVLLITFAALLAVQGKKLKEVQEDLKKAQHSEELPKPPDGKTWEEWIREWRSGQEHLVVFKEAFGDKSIDDVKIELERAKEYVEKTREGAKASGFSTYPDAVKDTLISYGKLISEGKGTEVPSCWTHEDGTVEYIYDVKLTPTGLVMRETNLAHRAEDWETLPVQNIVLGQDISEDAFLAATSHLFEFSQSKECRFFVRVFDSTGPTEKAVYKSRLKAVEARFYKFISSESF
ncbi:MAG: hypothetical protein J4F29_23015 [Candidatus Latescibacteria bacterium]|nr:hypothetical protein [Candidatus Latescibacterota bacterium]